MGDEISPEIQALVDGLSELRALADAFEKIGCPGLATICDGLRIEAAHHVDCDTPFDSVQNALARAVLAEMERVS